MGSWTLWLMLCHVYVPSLSHVRPPTSPNKSILPCVVDPRFVKTCLRMKVTQGSVFGRSLHLFYKPYDPKLSRKAHISGMPAGQDGGICNLAAASHAFSANPET